MPELIDTSLWIAMYRDRTGNIARHVKASCGPGEPVFARPIAMEILQGCSTDAEWKMTKNHLDAQAYVEMTEQTWVDASRIYFDLQRASITVRSSLDCCIAQLALEHNCTLLHNDRDFEAIATIRPLKQQRLDLSKV